ncbi:MAG: APC family permease, partial [Planctomycetota bacterium]
ALGVVGLVCVDYLYVILHGDSSAVSPGTRVALAAGLIAMFTILNAMGLRVGRPMQNALTVAKTLAVFLLVLIALFSEGEGFKESALAQAEAPTRSWLTVLAVSILPVLFAYGGWQQGSFLAGAAKNPQRDVPLGILGGTLVVVVAYIAINLSFLDLLGFEAAAASTTIGADAARAALDPLGYGDMAARIFAGMVVISALGILNTICMAPPYVLHAMAKKGLFFSSAGRLDPRFGSPLLGVIVQGGWGIVLLLGAFLIFDEGPSHALDVLLTGVVFVDWVFFALCGYALLRLRGVAGNSLLSPAGLLALGFALLATAITAGALWTSYESSLAGILVCGAGLLAFLLMRKRSAD